MTNAYSKLSKGPKRLIWVGYILYLIWMNLIGGWDAVIDGFIKPITDNDAIDFAIMLILYWAIVFLILWVIDGFE